MRRTRIGLKTFPATVVGDLRNRLPVVSLFLLLIFTNLIVGCHYYRVQEAPPEGGTVEQAVQEEKYIIVHQADYAWHIVDVVVDENKNEIRGTIAHLDDDHRHFETATPGKINKYSPSRSDPSIEVHIYVNESHEQDSLLTLPLSAVNKIELYNKDTAATTVSYTAGILGSLAGVLAIALVVLLLTSCPFVYISDGGSYHFVGEMYGGAIYPSLERDDYMQLPGFTSVNSEYTLKITNELMEIQHTNLAQLLVVEHTTDIDVLVDKHGTIHTLSEPHPPVRAVSDMNVDYTSSVATRNSSVYMFNDDASDNENNSSLTLSFARHNHADTGKLILRAKNSYWLDYIYGEFNEQFGSYYNEFANQQKKIPAAEHIQWSLDQEIPLSVYLQTDSGWELIDYFDVVGPLASRDLVMPINLSRVSGEEVKIKLQCGFMFWEVDYAAMDLSENVPVDVSHHSPFSAIDEKGTDVTALIAGTDDQYLIQPEPGNEAIVRYSVSIPEAGNKQTVFLHSRGYYEYIRDYSGYPDLISLRRFKNKGAFTEFSKQRFFEAIDSDHSYVEIIKADHGN